MKLIVTVVVTTALAATLASAPAAVHFTRPDDAVRYRQAVYALMGHHTERIGEMVSTGDRPFDPAEAQASASIVEMLSKLPMQAFEPGMQTPASRAKDVVWTRNDEFRALAAQMREAVATLSAVSRTGDPRRMRAAFGDATKACKACHDEFKKR